MRRALAWAGWGLLGLFVLIVCGGAGIYLYLRTSLPESSGTVELPGLSASVTITRDRFWIPTIRASNEHDADFALGFVHAQDRLFEMDMLRRYGEGRIAEWAGKGELPRDELMRTLGLDRAAKRDFAALSQPVRQALQAYADGINAYIAQHSGARLLYYYFVAGPEKWQAADTLVVAKVLAYYLSQNFRNELLHAALACRVAPAALIELYPDHPKDALTTLAALAPIYREMHIDRLARTLSLSAARRLASNNWVIAGAHATTGKPILANDPHLLYAAPSVWYLARIVTPQFDISGATIPGAPLFVVGHNRHIGWGLTETGGDVEDDFIEKTDPAHPGQYLTPDGWRPFETRRETIHVRGGADVAITVRSTRHGPMISDLVPDGQSAANGGYAVALQTTYLQPNDKTMQAFWEMNRAANWDEFRNAARNYSAPQMNIVFADTGGTIAFIAPARVPIRKNGEGWVPHPGWTGAYDWTGSIPFDELPQAVNPASGHFITANNRIVPESYPYFLTHNWAAPYRARRIAELIGAKETQAPADSAAIQADTVSLAARQLLPLLLRVQPRDAASAEAVRLLGSWDGGMRPGDAAPLIFMSWLRQLTRALFAKRLGDEFTMFWRPSAELLVQLLTTRNSWCGPGDAPDSCAALLAVSLQQAVSGLHRRLGGNPADWRWGSEHHAYFWSLISHVPVIGTWLSTAVPVGGGQYTIDAQYVQFAAEDHPFRADTGPGLRMILDFSDLAGSRYLLAPGMSGNLLSPHYSDLLDRWRRFQYIAIDREPAAATLTLTPSGGGSG